MWQQIKDFFITFFRRPQLPSAVVESNVPMRKQDSVHEVLRQAGQEGLLQEPTLFTRVKRFFMSLVK